MNVAYFDCFSGISGDMTLAALVDAGADLSVVQVAVDSMQLGAVRVSSSNTIRNGFRGRLLAIEHPREHVHRNLRDIHALIRRARIASNAKDLALRFFERIARAEAKVHGTTIDRIEFHEVGAIDSIVDMVGVAIAWDMLGIEKAYASAIPTGTGMVRIAHGPVSVPAPATAELLIGVPIAPTQIAMEMTTPTGAAIITELASEFGPIPSMQVGRIGYGAGNKSIPDRPNLLRILIGNALKPKPRDNDQVLILECNLDDVPGEQIGFAMERLWAAGALDVFVIPIQMKKNRPGLLLSVIANPEDRERFESILFQQTGTLGIRYRKQSRTVLPRAIVDVSSPWGAVSGKVSKLPTGEVDFSPEYEDCCRIATQHGLRLVDVIAEIRECYYSIENERELQQATTPVADDLEPEESEFDFDPNVAANEEVAADSVDPEVIEHAVPVDDDPVDDDPVDDDPVDDDPVDDDPVDDDPVDDDPVDDARASLDSVILDSKGLDVTDLDARTIENVNAYIFGKEAALEDEFPVTEDSIETKIEPPLRSVDTVKDEPSVIPRPKSDIEQNEYFRWDSSPWAMERLAPFPPRKPPGAADLDQR